MIDALFNSANQLASKKLLEAALVRHEALASNIANVETPGYKRLDLSKTFAEELKTQLQGGHTQNLAALKTSIEADSSAISTRADGNTVQLDRELLAMATNSTNVEVLTQFVSGSLKQLRTAITGRVL